MQCTLPTLQPMEQWRMAHLSTLETLYIAKGRFQHEQSIMYVSDLPVATWYTCIGPQNVMYGALPVYVRLHACIQQYYDCETVTWLWGVLHMVFLCIYRITGIFGG